MMDFVDIPLELLSQEALDGLIDEFITREGTDYGLEEHTFEMKRNNLRRQLDRGDAVIVFDPESETSNIILKEALSRR